MGILASIILGQLNVLRLDDFISSSRSTFK